MLTPVDIQNKTFKGGIGFDKKEVEMFMSQLATDYETLYRSNVELNDKVATLTESLQHYRATEDSMQKALTISEKTAEETINAANDKARQINNEATAKAEAIITKANQDLIDTKNEIDRLQKLYEMFKARYTNVLEQQLKLVNHEIEEIDLGPDFESSYTGAPASQGSSSTLGDGLGGGAYAGSSADDRFDQTNQSPTITHTSLGMDPFADAANGGGRFSRQTGKGYIQNKSGKKQSESGDKTEKTGLNIKSTQSNGKPKVRKNFSGKKSEDKKEEPIAKPAPKAVEPENIAAAEPVKPQPIPEAAPTPKPQEAFEAEKAVETAAAAASEEVLDDDTYSGEVESKANSNMIDSEDNYSEGFDFIVGEDNVENDIPTILPTDDDVLVGDVEDNSANSNLIGNDDDDNEGFKFM